jgi:Flp pilus assembly protein TadB
MVYDGRNYLASWRGIFMIVFVIMAIWFCFSYNIGIFLVFGLLFYFMFFMSRDKKMKKAELNSILFPGQSRMIYNRTLPVEIP